MDLRARLQARLEHDRDEILRLGQDLVRIPTENPPGDTVEAFDYITRWLDRHAVDYEMVTAHPSMPNLMATAESGSEGRHLVLNAHLDVFPAGDRSIWSQDPFSGAVQDGKLFGRGATDMKTGCVASMITYVYLQDIMDKLRGKLTLTLVSDEETFGPWGARHLLQARPDALGDCMLSGEPSSPYLVRFGERGMLWLKLTARGEGGHGAYVHLSRNVIEEMTALLRDLASLGNIRVQMPSEVLRLIEEGQSAVSGTGVNLLEGLDRVTVNMGTIRGGDKVNLVPTFCEAEVDFRCAPGKTTGELLDRIDEIMKQYPSCTYEILNQFDPNYSDPDHPMISLVQRNAERVRGIVPSPAIGLGCTDCRLWRARGTAAIVYGPSPTGMGAPDEYVMLDDFFGTVWVHVLSAFDYLNEGRDGS